MNIPKKLFERDIESVNAGLSDIYFFTKENIEDGQKGFRINAKGEKIEDWIGDNYIVVGIDSCCGDPIIVDVSDERLPVFNMFHDDWNSLIQIADSFEQFLEILHKIDNTDIKDENKKDNLLEEIRKIVNDEAMDYWDPLIQSGYEFLNDLD